MPSEINQSNQYEEKINNIKTQFFSALDEFKKYYVFYNKNPEVNEYQNFYVNSKGQLQNMSKELFLTTNNIDKSIEELDNKMKSISLKLDSEKNLQAELLKIYKDLKYTKNGSEILIDDSKGEYNNQYYYNWELIMGIILSGILIGIIFRPKLPINIKSS